MQAESVYRKLFRFECFLDEPNKNRNKLIQ